MSATYQVLTKTGRYLDGGCEDSFERATAVAREKAVKLGADKIEVHDLEFKEKPLHENVTTQDGGGYDFLRRAMGL